LHTDLLLYLLGLSQKSKQKQKKETGGVLYKTWWAPQVAHRLQNEVAKPVLQANEGATL
jgi:hypothetical protein